MRGDRPCSDGQFVDEPVMFRPSFRPVFDPVDVNLFIELSCLVASGQISETTAAAELALDAEYRSARLRLANVVQLRPRVWRGTRARKNAPSL